MCFYLTYPYDHKLAEDGKLGSRLENYNTIVNSMLFTEEKMRKPTDKQARILLTLARGTRTNPSRVKQTATSVRCK